MGNQKDMKRGPLEAAARKGCGALKWDEWSVAMINNTLGHNTMALMLGMASCEGCVWRWRGGSHAGIISRKCTESLFIAVEHLLGGLHDAC